MRRHDLLDDYASPAMRASVTPKRWPVPVTLLAVCCVLQAAI